MIDHSHVQRYWQETETGNPIPFIGDVQQWALWIQNHDTVVATTRANDPDDPDRNRLVSTIFVGIAPHPTQRPPMVYETLVFDEHTVLARRLSASRSEAEESHHNLVAHLTSLQ